MLSAVSSEFGNPKNSAGPAHETELKLLVSPDDLKRIRQHPLIKQCGRGVTRKLRSIYFDTPNLYLSRRGIALRVRRDGGQWIQAVKCEGTVRGGVHRRMELETRVSGPKPDCLAVHDQGLGRLFSSQRLRDRLQPVFTTEINRTTHLLQAAADTTVEICIDRGEIHGRDRVESVCELELELKSGAVKVLYEAGLQLLDWVPLRVGSRSKAERGFALYRNEQPLPVKGHPPALVRDMSVSDAFKEIVWTTLGHLQANADGVFTSDDPEFLHQARVSLRRLRSALRVFAAALNGKDIAHFESEFKWLANVLGPARDWDVFMTETLPLIERDHRDHAGLAMLAKRGARSRISARRRLRAGLDSQRYWSLILKFCAWLAAEEWLKDEGGIALPALQEPVPAFAKAVVEGRWARAKKRGRNLKSLSTAELHRLRIAVKKLRYAVGFFSTLYDSQQTSEMLAQCRHLQDILGTINDAATVSGLIEAALWAAPYGPASEAREAVLRWSLRRAERLNSVLQTAWKRFRHIRKFW